MENLGIEFISVHGMPPGPFVELAADLGCRNISCALQAMRDSPNGYPHWSLKENSGLRREMIAAMRDRGVTLASGEGFLIQPGPDMREAWSADLEILAELGGRRINCVSFEPDQARAFDQLAILCETAAGYGIETLIEFVPCFALADLPTAVAAVRHVGRPDCRLMMDTMHLGRSGVTPAELAALDPQLVGYIQICDAPRVPTLSDYLEEAMYERMVPGEGELPLKEMLAALPRDRVISLEVASRSEARAGAEPRAWLERGVAATRALLAEIDAAASA